MTTVEISTPHSSHQVREAKTTSLGLYVTAREAYEMWKGDPEEIKVIDVRTFEEYVLIGHAEMAANVPLAFPTYTWDANKGNYSVVINSDFIAHVQRAFQSGGYHPGHVPIRRSQRHGDQCAGQGWLYEVHNIIDGFEGDKVEDPESVFHGKRMRNGWKNSAPWTYQLDPELVWLPSEVELDTLRDTLDL